MFSNKSFISLYILPDSLYLVQLSKDKKKLLKKLRLDLPKGLLQNYKIQDPSVFAQVLETIWKKYGIGEKDVGIVIPEFAVFTKLLTLPKIGVAEMGEAIAWQAQEFLPQDLEETHLDWKIVQEKEANVEVFVAAIRKDILMGYVNALEIAGLSPLFVETPSLSLVRLSASKGAVLCVYVNSSQSLVVLADGEKIVASSVVQSTNRSDILSIATRITNHFSTVSVSKVMVGGFANDLVGELEKSFSKPVEWIEPKISNATKEDIQTYLVPISLSFAKLTEPVDPYSLNLLPGYFVEKYQSNKSKVQLWGVILTVTLFVWISLFATLATYLYMSQSIKTLTEKNSGKTDITTMRDEAIALAKRTNSLSTKVLSVKNVSVVPQNLLNLLYSSQPEGVTITSYTLNFELGEVSVSGKAENRLALIEFKQNLEKQGDLENVTIPISSFEAETNLSFNLSAMYKPVTKSIIKK